MVGWAPFIIWAYLNVQIIKTKVCFMNDVHGKNKSAIIFRSNNNDIAPTLLITTALPLTPALELQFAPILIHTLWRLWLPTFTLGTSTLDTSTEIPFKSMD